MNYTTFRTGQNEVGGGFNPINPENPAGTVTVYINTDNITETLGKIEGLGGKVLAQPMQIPGVGLFAVFCDLDGNKVALLQPDMQQS